MNLNDPKEIASIVNPRVKRIAEYRLIHVTNKKAEIDNSDDLDKRDKDKLKREVESLPLFSNAIYEVRLKRDDYEEMVKQNLSPYRWVELKDFSARDFNKIEYAKKETTALIKSKLQDIELEKLRNSYFDSPIFTSSKPVQVKKVRQRAWFKDLYEITPGRYVYSLDTFMVYVFKEKGSENNLRTIKFLKFLDAVRIINTDKPSQIDYTKLIEVEKSKDEFLQGVEYDLLFTLSKNDLVYLPEKELSKEELSEIDWNNKKELNKMLFIVKDMNPSRREIVFQKATTSDSIKITEVSAKILFGTNKKEQIEEIKYGTVNMLQRCIKVFTDKLGKKVAPYWVFPNGCWNKDTANKLGLINNFPKV